MSADKTRLMIAQSAEELRIELKGAADIKESYSIIHRRMILVARAAFQMGLVTGYNPNISLAGHASREFPLPPKRVLREDPDPNGGDVFWRWRLGLEYRRWNTERWFELGNDGGERVFSPTPERIDLWHSLKHEPYREVPDNGDE